MAISKKDIEHLHELARIEPDKDSDKLAGDLAGILDYAAVLNKANTEGAEEMTHALDVKNEMRKDGDEDFPKLGGREKILEAFPEKEKTGDVHGGTWLKVKAPIKV